jgi:hypothetical protein
MRKMARNYFNKNIRYICLMITIAFGFMTIIGTGGGGGDGDVNGVSEPIQYVLTVNTVGQGTVTLDPPGGVYDENTVVTLTATPDAAGDSGGWDYDFAAWSGELTGSSSTTTLTMDSDKSVTATFNLSNCLLIKENDYRGRDYQNTTWMVASIRNASGDYITDLTVDDFQLTEYIISKADGSVKAEAPIDMQAFVDSGDEKLGFFKSATDGQPVDIVFLLDKASGLVDYYADLRLQITSLVNEMIENHVDFRMAFLLFNACPDGEYNLDFYGLQEVDMLLEKIESLSLSSAGTTWRPNTAYDALLLTPWLGFRENARKVCVAVTDLVPQTVYGNYWYIYGCTAATPTAAELFLQDSGIELYYAQRGEDPAGIDFYYQELINPRAGDNASGFSSLRDAAGAPLATRLSFPFDREELKTALGIATAQTVTDTQYLLSWKSSFEWNAVEDDALFYHPEDYEVRVTLKVPDPDRSGEYIEDSCSYPINKEPVDIVLNVTDEEGTPFNGIWAFLYQKMGGREISAKWQLRSENGQISVLNLPKGTYNVFICADGSSKYTYENLRAIHRETIEVTEGDVTFDMTVAVADQDAELYKTRGLLKDIGDWRLPGDPFQSMVNDATAWLDAMESNGLSWKEMAAIKRFYIGLSGFANVIEYSQLEAEGAIKDFDKIVTNFRDIVDQVEKIGNDTTEDWIRELASGLMTIVDVLITHGEFTLQKEALETAVHELLIYASTELTQDLRKKVIEQLPLGDYNDLLKIIVNTLIDAAFGDNASEPDWEPVFDAARAIALDKAIEEVQLQVTEAVVDIVETTIQDLPLSGSLTSELKTLVQTILKAFISGDIQESTFSQAIEDFAASLADDILTVEPVFIANAVYNVFDAVDDALKDEGVDPDISGFLVGMSRDLTLLAIPKKEGADVKFDMNTDAVVSVLVKYGVYYVILKDYCIDDIQAGLDQLLYGAMNHVPVGDSDNDWTSAMYSDFVDYREIIRNLQGTAWDALRLQNDITEWANQMKNLCDLLDDISVPLDFLANLWPDLQDTADDVHSFIAVLDGMQILANAISFGLKVDSLDTFGDRAAPMHQTLFY